MTIFGKVVTDFLIQGINAIIQQSLDSDQGSAKQMRERAYGLFEEIRNRTGIPVPDVRRNLELSKGKRDELENLKKVINDIGGKNNILDEDLFKELFRSLTDYNKKITLLSSNEGKSSGYTEKALTNLRTFLEQAHNKIFTLKLENISFDNSIPLHCLQYHACVACWHYLYEKHVNFSWLPQDIPLIKEKEACILTALERAIQDCSEPTTAIIIRRAKERAEQIQRDNEEINGRYIRARISTDYVKQSMLEAISELSYKPESDFDDEFFIEENADETITSADKNSTASTDALMSASNGPESSIPAANDSTSNMEKTEVIAKEPTKKKGKNKMTH